MHSRFLRPAALAFSLCTGLAFAQPIFAEQINSFDVNINLAADRTTTITENINYDFGDVSRHGIYRVIPDTYDRNGGKYRLDYSIKEVDVDGAPATWVQTGDSGSITIKIGEADRTITGAHVYTIIYSTNKAINDFSNEQEFYWNVTGNGWNVPIIESSVAVIAPASSTRATCFTGFYGSDSTDCVLHLSPTTISAKTSGSLVAGEGLTVAVGYPASTFRQLSWQEKLAAFLNDNLALMFPILVLIGMSLIWFKWGRDPRGRGTVIAQYEEPERLAPAEMSALLGQTVSEAAITSTILDLARRGYLKIKYQAEAGGWFNKKPTFTLVKLKPVDAQCKPFESKIHNGLFEAGDEVDPADVEDFWKVVQAVRTDIFQSLKDHGWMPTNPAVVRGAWSAIAVFVAFSSFFMTDLFGALMVGSGIISALIILAFGWFMPRVSKQGAIVIEEIEGFKLFLNVTEKARLEFHNAPSKTPELFERFLPAAVAFGVEEQWAEQFKDLKISPSYIEGNGTAFTAGYYAGLSSQLNHVSSVGMYRAPSSAGSGGSGFSGGGSGGGFGGGGGGSW